MIHRGFEMHRCTIHGRVVPLQAIRERLTAAFYHRIRMPTGCSRSLGEEEAGLTWFKDTKIPLAWDLAHTNNFCASRLAHFNRFCSRPDALSQWGSSAPTEVDGTAPLCTLYATAHTFPKYSLHLGRRPLSQLSCLRTDVFPFPYQVHCITPPYYCSCCAHQCRGSSRLRIPRGRRGRAREPSTLPSRSRLVTFA